LEIANYIGKNTSDMVIRYKKVMDEGGNVTLEQGLKRERALGLAHYIEALGDGATFSNAEKFIADESRPRSKL
jgi:vancomycin permeability regulator SanA